MLLSEEYIARHNLKVPIVKHMQNAAIFLRDARLPLPIVLSVKYVNDEQWGPKYIFRQLYSVHDGYQRRGAFETITADEISWDDYEDYVISLGQKWKGSKTVLHDKKDIVLAAWEMFVHSFDTAMIAHATDENLFKSLDRELDVLTRYTSYALFLHQLQDENANVFEIWNREFLNYVKISCHWLSELLSSATA